MKKLRLVAVFVCTLAGAVPALSTTIDTGSDVLAGFSTNPYSLTDDILADIMFRLRPWFFLTSQPKPVAFETGLKFDFAVFPDALNKAQNAAWAFLDAKAYGQIEFNRGGVVSLKFRDDLTSSRRPGILFTADLANMKNQLDVGTSIRPRDAWEIQLDAIANIETWPVNWRHKVVFNRPEALDNMAVYGKLKLSYEFLKNTNVFLSAIGGSYSVPNDPTIKKLYPLWTAAGVDAALSDTLTGTVSVGYSLPFIQLSPAGYVASDTTVAITAAAELAWDPKPSVYFAAGFSREMQPLPIFFDVYSHKLYLKYRQDFSPKVSFSLSPSANWMEFGQPANTRGKNSLNRGDVAFDVDARVTYHLKDWLGVGLSEQSSFRWSNADSLIVDSGASWVSGQRGTRLLFQRHEILGEVTFSY